MVPNRILTQLRESKERFEHSVIHGAIQDLVQYKFLVGQISGLQTAIDICKNTFKELGEIDD